MKSNWEKVRLEQVVDFNPSEKIEKYAPTLYLSMNNVLPYVKNPSGYEIRPFTGGSKFRNGDTLLARITPCLENGKTVYINSIKGIACGSTEFIVLRAKDSRIQPEYLYYLAISPDFRDNAIKSMTGTSGRQRVQIDLLKMYEFLLPDFQAQKRIVSILEALDNKIASNTQINKNLFDFNFA